MGPTKEKFKQKATGPQDTPRAPEGDHHEDSESVTSQAPKCTILSVVEGRAFLEEEGFIDQEEGLDLDVMVGMLIQISLMTDMLARVSHAVRSAALILVQMKLESVGEAMLSAMETRLEGMVARATETAASLLRMLVDTMPVEIKAASMDVATSAT